MFNIFISTIFLLSSVSIKCEKLLEIVFLGKDTHWFFLTITEKYLLQMQWNFSMVEASRPEPAITEEKLEFFIFKIAIWDYFDIYEATYMSLPS